jgi:hypothetical protein
MESVEIEKIAQRGIAHFTSGAYNLSDNSVGILSRVAEGLGPAKPQQPVKGRMKDEG